MAGIVTARDFRVRSDDGPRMTRWSGPRVEHCAAPSAVKRRVESAGAVSPRRAATMLLALMAQRARLDGLSR